MLNDYAEQWIDQRRNSKGEPLRPLTRDKYRSSLRVHIYPSLGDLPLDQITRAVVRSWHDKLDTGPPARAHAYSTLRTILNTAVLVDELLPRNPAYIRGAGVSGGRKSLRPGSLDALAAMVDARAAPSDVSLGRDEDGDAFGWVHVRRAVVLARTG